MCRRAEILRLSVGTLPSGPFTFSLFNVYLFLAVLGVPFRARAFASCGRRGLLSGCGGQASHCRGFCRCRAPALGTWASDCPEASGSSLIRDSICVPCIGRRILNHWTTREAPFKFLTHIKDPKQLFLCNLKKYINLIYFSIQRFYILINAILVCSCKFKFSDYHIGI